MIGGILASASLFGQGIFDTLNQSALFSYVIPFLLIFALVFGILTRMSLFKENKAVTSIVALSVGLMSLQFNVVPKFFSDIFPKFGIALAVILVILILIALFTDPSKPGIMYALLGVGAVITFIVIVQSAGSLGINVGPWLQDNWPNLLVILVIIGGVIAALAAIIGSGKDKTNKNWGYRPLGFFPPTPSH